MAKGKPKKPHRYNKTMSEQTKPDKSAEPKTQSKTQPKTQAQTKGDGKIYVYRVPAVDGTPKVDGEQWTEDLNKIGYVGYTAHSDWITIRALGRFPSCETDDAKKLGCTCAIEDAA